MRSEAVRSERQTGRIFGLFAGGLFLVILAAQFLAMNASVPIAP